MNATDASHPRISFADQCENPCCSTMLYHLTNRCKQHSNDPYACPDALVSYNAVFDEYGIIVHDGGPSSVMIGFCPWCGVKLPESQRDRYFDELDRMGLRPDDPLLPKGYRSSAWRKQRST
jgi:hypothetical protein